MIFLSLFLACAGGGDDAAPTEAVEATPAAAPAAEAAPVAQAAEAAPAAAPAEAAPAAEACEGEHCADKK